MKLSSMKRAHWAFGYQQMSLIVAMEAQLFVVRQSEGGVAKF